jgi:NAD(P)-dependent dehydrogenase (short-subunit alcohol dehydrogenase family)
MNAADVARGTDTSLAGRVAWVTGASRGLGRAVALRLAEAGARVALTARDARRLETVRDEIAAAGGHALLAPGSVADVGEVLAAADTISTTWGRLDVLVNNAGISPSMTRSEEVSADEWRQVLDVNLSGAFYCAQAAGRRMTDGGSIVNVSSVHGAVGMPRLAAYSATKGGLEALTRTLALEWADRDIRVNALAPGYVETDMTAGLRANDRWRQRLLDAIPMGRFAREEDLVPAVLYLASAASSYMTGTTMTLDGGWTAR